MWVNLHDSNFAHDNFSTAYQTSQHIQWVRGLTSFDGVTIFTDEWINNPIVDSVQSRVKIAWLHEPYCLHISTYERAETNFHKFDSVLTYHRDFLERYPDKCRLAIYGGTWIDKSDWSIKPKSKLCSMLVGSKMSTEGHIIRHDIAQMIKEQGYNVDVYGVGGHPVGYGQEVKKMLLNDYCFSIAVETCREDNLFTEWLLDCFALGTIPIFWGAPNIYEYFEPSGILQFDTVDRLQKILAGLTTGQWVKQLPAIYLNLLEMQGYSITEDWLYQNVLREFE